MSDDVTCSGRRLFLVMFFLFLEDAYARTTVHFCEGACLRFLTRRVLLARSFYSGFVLRFRNSASRSITRSDSDARLARNGHDLNEPDVICGGGQFGSLDDS